MSEKSLTPRQVGELIVDLQEELEETRMEVNLLEGRLKHGDLAPAEYKAEKDRLNAYMKSLIGRVTGLQKSISKKDADLAREIRALSNLFQIEDLGGDKFIIYLAAGPEHLYAIPFSLDAYPGKPVIEWPAEVMTEIGDPGRFLKPLRDWDPGYPSPVHEIFSSFESYAFNYFNAVDELKNELREIEGEWAMELLRDNYIRVTLISFNKQEFHVEVNLERYPSLEWVFTPGVEQLVGAVGPFMARYASRPAPPRMIDVLHDVSWEIDKRTKLEFEYKVLVNNVTEAVSGLRFDTAARTISGCIHGELKTAATTFEFVADFSKGYPERPPEIALTPGGEIDEDVLGKMESFIAGSGTTWTPSSLFIDLLNQVHMAIFKSSIITCVICHKLFCPTCDESLFLPKGKVGKTCHVECANCHRPYHKHCFDKTIQSVGKCAVCMQSFLAQDSKGEQATLQLDF